MFIEIQKGQGIIRVFDPLKCHPKPGHYQCDIQIVGHVHMTDKLDLQVLDL